MVGLVILLAVCKTTYAETIKIAVVNPDNYRIVKFGCLIGELASNEYRSMAYAEVADGGHDPAHWTGVGAQQDFIGTVLSNAGYTIDYFTSETLPLITPADYNIVIVQDPLKDNYRQFDKSVETTLPDLLEYTISEEFIQKLINYFNAGGDLILVGDAVRLLENPLGFGKVINTDDVANIQSNPHSRIPAKWLFIRGNPFCGVDRNGNGTYIVESSVLVDSGIKLADISFFDGNDLPYALTWSDTVYFPVDGVSLLDVRVQGSGEYVLRGDICHPPVYTVTVDDVLSHFVGYTTCSGNKRIYYIGSDSFFDYHLIDHQGAWHARQTLEMKYTTTSAGQQIIVSLVNYISEWKDSITSIPATIDINPGTLNLKSKGNWITVYTELPEDYSVEDIDIYSIFLSKINGESLASPLYTVGPSEIGDYDENDIPDLMVKFDRQELISLLEITGTVELSVYGELLDGTPFEGCTNIQVIDKGKK